MFAASVSTFIRMPISYTFSFSLFEKQEVNAGSSRREELGEHLCIYQAGELTEAIKSGKLTSGNQKGNHHQ